MLIVIGGLLLLLLILLCCFLICCKRNKEEKEEPERDKYSAVSSAVSAGDAKAVNGANVNGASATDCKTFKDLS